MQVINVEGLGILAKERLEDAKTLYIARRYQGAVYICGYAIEFGLKKKICKTLGRDEYPDVKDLKTHKLDTLLIFSGVEKMISTQYKAEWSLVKKWDPEQRYSTNPVSEADANSMIKATETLLGFL